METNTTNTIKTKIFGALLAAALSTASVHAAGTETWLGNTDAKWNTAGNWTNSGGSTPPANGDSLVFGAQGSSSTTRVQTRRSACPPAVRREWLCSKTRR